MKNRQKIPSLGQEKGDIDRYKRLQQEVQYEVRQANKKYMEDVSTDYKENSKTFSGHSSRARVKNGLELPH